MATRIRLSDGTAFLVAVNCQELHQSLGAALAHGVPLIEIRNGAGQRRAINLQQIAWLEEITPEDLTPSEEEILRLIAEGRQAQRASPIEAR